MIPPPPWAGFRATCAPSSTSGAGQGLVLAQRRIPEECSEIVQAPLLLHHPRLKNTVVTADAAHAQSATASLITTQGGDYLPTVKANQPGTQ